MYTIKSVTYLVICFTLIFDASADIDIMEENNEEKELVTFAKKIYQEECKHCRTTLIIHTPEDVMSTEFLKSVATYELTTSFLTVPLNNFTLEEEYIGTKEKPDMVLMFLDSNSYNISVVVFGIEVLSIWNIRALHLFLVTGVDGMDYKYWLKESFEALWEKQVLRAIICFHLEGTMKVFTYNPFLYQYDIDLTSRKDESPLFMGPIKDMYGHTIKGYYLDTVFKTSLVEEVKNGKVVLTGFDGKYVGKSTF